MNQFEMPLIEEIIPDGYEVQDDIEKEIYISELYHQKFPNENQDIYSYMYKVFREGVISGIMIKS